MATLTELSESGHLVTIDPLEEHELPWRTLYATPDFIKWLDSELPSLPHNRLYAKLTPEEEVFAAMADFVAGEPFSSDRRFKKLTCNPNHHVWEIKTEEVRIFGWIPSKDCFVCCYGAAKDRILIENSYLRFIAQTAFTRNNLDLDPPKHLESQSYIDVISTKN